MTKHKNIILYLKSLIISWQFLLGIGLITLSGLVYELHYMFFHDLHHIFIYLLGDIAFIPLEVLLVTLIIHKLLTVREKKEKLHKLNMVIGVFFSEVGTPLLKSFAKCDIESKEVSALLLVNQSWSDKNFSNTALKLLSYDYHFDISKGNLKKLRDFIISKRDFLLALLANPNLLEHDTFTDLLWAVFHLMEELEHRNDITTLEKIDTEHLTIDIKRVYHLLILEWLEYMRHLKKDYPYLFSLALRTNPFDPHAEITVK